MEIHPNPSWPKILHIINNENVKKNSKNQPRKLWKKKRRKEKNA